MIHRTIKSVLRDNLQTARVECTPSKLTPLRLLLPYKSEKLSKYLRSEVQCLNTKLNCNMQPVFTSKKIRQLVTSPEKKDPLVARSCVVYSNKCTCDMYYVGFTSRHIHQRIAEHQRPSSSNSKHCQLDTNDCTFSTKHFTVIARCKTVFDCRVREAIEIYFRRPQLNARDEFRCTTLYRCRY